MSLVSLFAQTMDSFNYDYSYTTPTSTSVDGGSVAALLFVVALVSIGLLVGYIFFAICLMKIFKKAGRQDTWAAWIPIYNMWVYFEVAGRPGWWALLSLISPLNIVLGIIGSIDLAKRFGKTAGFGVLMAILPIIGYPMLAFGDAQYDGKVEPTPLTTTTNTTPPAQTPVA